MIIDKRFRVTYMATKVGQLKNLIDFKRTNFGPKALNFSFLSILDKFWTKCFQFFKNLKIDLILTKTIKILNKKKEKSITDEYF